MRLIRHRFKNYTSLCQKKAFNFKIQGTTQIYNRTVDAFSVLAHKILHGSTIR